MITKLSVGLILSVQLAACQSIEYYSQAVGGQSSIWMNQREIQTVLSDPSVDTETKARLQTAYQARRFASSELLLPDNKSYSRYVDLERDYVIWNVVATPPYSVDAVESCFPIVGCVSYRGYYQKKAALEYGKKLKQRGLDVYVGGVSAYSTLGWFDDPLLNTMLARSDAAIAGLVFHELAHQIVYIKNDTRFNESFATAVEQIGLRQWAAEQGVNRALENYFSERAKRKVIVQMVLESREQMRTAYTAYASAGESRLAEIKRVQFEGLKNRYAELKRAGGGTPGFDRFFASNLNNASLALFGEYHGWVDAFERLFEDSNQDWSAFYSAVENLSQKPQAEREKQLQQLASRGAG